MNYRKGRHRLGEALFLVVISAATCSCGGGLLGPRPAFETTWQDDHGASIAELQKHLGVGEVPVVSPVAVGTVPDGLVGVSLRSGKTWSFRHDLDSRPSVSASVVVATGGDEVFAVSARDGHRLWARPSLGKLRAAADDGQMTLLDFLPGSMSGSLLLSVDRDGQTVQQVETSATVGRPAMWRGVAFLPWGNQYVSAVDMEKGGEVARVVIRHKVSHSYFFGGSLFFGEVGVTRFDERIGRASANGATYFPGPSLDLPGQPKWLRDGGHVPSPRRTAYDSVALYAQPASDGVRADSGVFYATYYRLAMGYHAKDKSLAWVQLIDDRIIGGAAFRGGVALCDDSGVVRMYHGVSGAVADVWSLGDHVRTCVVQADGVELNPTAGGGKMDPLSEQIYRAIDLRDARLVPMYRILIGNLGAQPDENATKRLLDLAQDGRTPASLMASLRERIAHRTNGAEFMMQELKRGYDFLSDRLRPPPVGPLADALTQMKYNAAAPLLARHLNDPATPSVELPHVARALLVLGSPAQLDDLESFFALSRVTAQEKNVVEATILVAEAMLSLGGDKARRVVLDASVDPMTVPEVAEKLKRVLSERGSKQPRK